MIHGPINVKSPNNISKWQMGFNSAFKGLKPVMLKVNNSKCEENVKYKAINLNPS
jgi:hypothetical protein